MLRHLLLLLVAFQSFLFFSVQEAAFADVLPVTSTDPLEATVRQTVVTIKGQGFGAAFEKGKDRFCLGDRCLIDELVSDFIVSWSDGEIQVKIPPIEGLETASLTIAKWKAVREDQTPVYDILKSAPIKIIFQPDPLISSLSTLNLIPGQTVLTVTGSGFEASYKAGSHRICFFETEQSVFCMRDEDQSRYLKSWSAGEIVVVVPPFVTQVKTPKFALRLFFPNHHVYKLVKFPETMTVMPAPFVQQYFPKMRNRDQYTILGVSFGEQKGKVLLGQTEVQINGWSDASITFTVPDISGSFDLIVENSQGTRSDPITVAVVFEKRFSEDLLSKHQQYLENIRIPEAWKITEGSPEIVVAVIDSGVDRNHEDLQGSFWINPKEVSGNGFDDDGNGFVDDSSGWDFGTESNRDIPVNDHGTMVASVIAAKKDNQKGIAGIAPNVKIMSLNVLKEDKISISAVQSAIKYAVDAGAHIINLSLSGKSSRTYQEVLQYAYDNNVLVVVAAGNDGKSLDDHPASPVCNDADLNIVLGVASVTKENTRSLFSNFGRRCIDISAPGSSLVAASSKGYVLANGTSFAAPVISGVAALLKSLHPDWNVEELKTVLLSTSVPIDLQNPDFREKLGRGLIDAEAVLKASRPIVRYQGNPRRNLVIQKTSEVISLEKPDTKPLEKEVMVKNPEAELQPEPAPDVPKEEVKMDSKKSKAEEKKLKKLELQKKRKEALKKKQEERKLKRLEAQKKREAVKKKRASKSMN